MIVDKEALRANFRRQIEAVSVETKENQSRQICQRLENYLNSQKGVWTLFSPLNDEPNLLSLIKSCTHLQWVFPRVESKTKMSFFKVSCMDEMVSSSWGLSEPPADKDCMVLSENIDGCILPGMAFDIFGNRLGRGGGFYDRFLENFKGLRLGVTFQQALTEKRLPSESHDQKMDIVISPENWIEVDRSEVKNGI